jgi:hypothetical protein
MFFILWRPERESEEFQINRAASCTWEAVEVAIGRVGFGFELNGSN